jgi:hypothetical protein
MQLRVVRLTATDQHIISYVWHWCLEGMMDEPSAEEFPKTVEEFNALGSIEMEIDNQELLE